MSVNFSKVPVLPSPHNRQRSVTPPAAKSAAVILGRMRRGGFCALVLMASATLMACSGGSASASLARCRSGTVSVTVEAVPVTVCVQVGSTVLMHGGGKHVDGYWPRLPAPNNPRVLRMELWSSTGMTATAGGGETPAGSQPSATTVEPGTVTARFKAVEAGTAEVIAKYEGKGEGYPLRLTVRVVPKA